MLHKLYRMSVINDYLHNYIMKLVRIMDTIREKINVLVHLMAGSTMQMPPPFNLSFTSHQVPTMAEHY